MTRTTHRISGLILVLFLCLHFTNHVIGLWGQNEHTTFLNWARNIYRNPAVETILMLAVLAQIASGLHLCFIRRPVSWRTISGLSLAIFLLIHTSAVFAGRYIFGLDTDIRFAAAGFYVDNWWWFFAPYYFIGILSFFVHVAYILKGRYSWFVVALGVTLASLLTAMLSGYFYQLDIPSIYLQTYS